MEAEDQNWSKNLGNPEIHLDEDLPMAGGGKSI
jgi:hypothetical protein